MRVMIADDHPLFAEGLRNLFASNNFDICRVVNNGEDAVMAALEEKPDVIFMDIDMPGLNGIEVTQKIKKEFTDIKIIMLTSFEEGDSLIKAIKAGASGYLLKSMDGEELVNSLKALDKGKNPFSAGLEEIILDELRQSNHKSKDKVLTERQLEVIDLLSQGCTYQEIADRLFLSERTIKYHMEQIKEKTGFKTQAQVIAYAKNIGEY